MSRVPDHNTLCRAFEKIVTLRRINRMLDVTADWFTQARVLKLDRKPLTLDSTHFESHHVSRHFEQRRKQTTQATDSSSVKTQEKPDKTGSFTRGRTNRKLPKAAFAVAAACHVILAVAVGTGAGSDAPSFDGLLYDAWRRAPVVTVVADAGFDSESNHRIARSDMGVRSIIPPLIGRQSKNGSPPQGHYRRLMHHRFARGADRRHDVQRWQSETVNSMTKRNLGSSLRARTAERREREMLLRAITHNIMI